jgi:hypothetical protein
MQRHPLPPASLRNEKAQRKLGFSPARSAEVVAKVGGKVGAGSTSLRRTCSKLDYQGGRSCPAGRPRHFRAGESETDGGLVRVPCPSAD